MEETLALIARAHEGDKTAREQLIEQNMGLVYTVAQRFLGRGCEWEDLVQIGSIGLMKAVDHFDGAFEVRFSTYAVPMIAGEIRRFLRDDGMLKVSRSLKENCVRIYQLREKLERTLGKEPTMEELSAECGISMEELVMSMEAGAEVESLHKTIYQGEGNEISLMDRIPEKENPQDAVLNKILLEGLLKELEPKERRLIYLRYFQDMTQMETASRLETSQVQVSRMEKRILNKLSRKLET